ncbi:tryptophan 7-halogenase [Streptomyces roseoverticillatus]|uniref:NAD(P)/FAD-dependent oxidoreductase n=1 Tax=Streptomyces roseoverticillatus TaxID=66429 RepID=UPI001F39A8B6|nr:tryptophan 7-halogenase [Streptomyces roseoverticillatus]MCF3106512.1 tryptophan 7-halogenase [Streptomyces roseoverticillatus]
MAAVRLQQGYCLREGLDVTLLERERFPRYRIGESLLPSPLPVLDLLGAREAGAVVREGVSVRGITFGEGRPAEAVYASRDGDRGDGSGTDGGRIAFGHLVDASGRAGVLAARQLRTRRFHDVFRNVATWGDWRGAAPVAAAPGGAICVFSLPGHGWLWAIPLHDGTLSAGLVADKHSFSAARQALGGTDAVYASRLRAVPALRGLPGGAELVSPLRVESDYSYTAERFRGPGYYLAVHSGLLAAAAIATVRRGEAAEAAVQAT